MRSFRWLGSRFPESLACLPIRSPVFVVVVVAPLPFEMDRVREPAHDVPAFRVSHIPLTRSIVLEAFDGRPAVRP